MKEHNKMKWLQSGAECSNSCVNKQTAAAVPGKQSTVTAAEASEKTFFPANARDIVQQKNCSARLTLKSVSPDAASGAMMTVKGVW